MNVVWPTLSQSIIHFSNRFNTRNCFGPASLTLTTLFFHFSNLTSNRTNIEFKVKPREDLFLEGPVRRLPRVSKDDEYPCQMHKQQAFSCLFRHYAKHNGLKKEDLVFYFVDELKADETPESVHLMANDEIWVERRKHDIEEEEPAKTLASNICYEQFRQLLPGGELSGDHSDVTFQIAQDGSEIFGHKAMLAVRSEYFRAMFKSDGMIESKKNKIEVKDYSKATFSRMLEFIYTNTILDFEETSSGDVKELLMLADEYILGDLREYCEIRAQQCLNRDSIGEFYLLSVTHNAEVLQKSCKDFVQKELEELKGYQPFRDEIEGSPALGLLVLDLQRNCDENPYKKRKRVISNFSIPSIEVVAGGSTSNTIAGATEN